MHACDGVTYLLQLSRRHRARSTVAACRWGDRKRDGGSSHERSFSNEQRLSSDAIAANIGHVQQRTVRVCSGAAGMRGWGDSSSTMVCLLLGGRGRLLLQTSERQRLTAIQRAPCYRASDDGE